MAKFLFDMYQNFRFLFAFCLFFPGFVLADPQPLRLQEAVDLALAQHIDLQSKRCLYRQDRNLSRLGFVPLLPIFSLGNTFQRDHDTPWKRHAFFSLTWEVNGFFTQALMWRKQALATQISLLTWKKKQAEVIYNTSEAYYALFVAQQKAQMLADHAATAAKIKAWIVAQHRLGKLPSLDVLSAKITHEEAQLACLTQEDVVAEAYQTLRQCWGPLDEATFEIHTQVPPVPDLPEDLLETTQDNLDTQLLARTRAQAVNSRHLAWASFVPTLGVSLSRDYPLGDTPASTTDKKLTYGVSLSWNLGKLVNDTVTLQNSYLASYQAQRVLFSQRLNQKTGLKQKWDLLAHQRKRQTLWQQQVRVTQAKADLAWAHYKLGKISLGDWAQAHQAALDTQLAILEHEKTLFLTALDIQRRAGILGQ